MAGGSTMRSLPLSTSIQRRANSGCAEQQLGGEQFLADSSLGFQLAAMTLAVRTRHRAAEQAGVLRRYPEVELKPASGILTNGAIYDSRRAGAFVFMSADGGLHFFILRSRATA